MTKLHYPLIERALKAFHWNVSSLVLSPDVKYRFKPNYLTYTMMMNSFSGMTDRRNGFSLISRREHCQRSSPSRISNTWAGFEPAQNLSSGFVEWSCAVVIKAYLPISGQYFDFIPPGKKQKTKGFFDVFRGYKTWKNWLGMCFVFLLKNFL